MAATYLALSSTAWAATKVMAYVMNASGSGVTIKVTRIWIQSYLTTAVTGGYETVELARFTDVNGSPTAVTPIKYDPNSAALPAQVTCGNAGTYPFTGQAVIGYRTIQYTDEVPAVGAALGWASLQTVIPLTLIWDSGYGHPAGEVEPITLVEGEGFAVISSAAASAVANTPDVYIEFTT